MPSINLQQSVLIFFMDGVGLGSADREINPFVRANTPHLTTLLGEGWYLADKGVITTDSLTLVPTDANLDMPGRPQSATGQATIVSGRNIPKSIGEHYGPKPNPPVAAELAAGTLFSEVVLAGGSAALVSPYPQGFFDVIESGRRMLSSIPQAVINAGIPLMTHNDLRAGKAVSPGFTNEGWRIHLGYEDMPLLTLAEAGQQLANIGHQHQLAFFEHWPSDRLGHRGTIDEAAAHLEIIDEVLGALISSWLDRGDEAGLLLITSDHGNIEEKNHRNHTRNPVPTILVGPGHEKWAAQINNLANIATIVRGKLELS